MIRWDHSWRLRTVLPNLRGAYYDIKNGLYNVKRWTPIIWHDADFDWDFLAAIMEQKLRWMADDFEASEVKTIHWERDVKRMRLCAALLRRLTAGTSFYSGMARSIPGADHNVMEDGKWKGAKWALHVNYLRAQDQRYLGQILGKHMNCWWV